MSLSLLDWLIIAVFFASTLVVAKVARSVSRSVSDFLAGSRVAGRYLLTMSEGMSGVGLVGIIANFEKFYHAGFAASWWGLMMGPIALIVALTGWIRYRYRETRAMTMAQFFEMRYSRRFRVFAGIVAWGAGVLNFGIFPGVVARFVVYFCGFPPSFHVGGFSVPTMAPVMLIMLSVTLYLVLSGGLVTIMITDFLQAQFINIVFLVVAFVMFARFTWPEVVGTLATAPPGKSLLNPFDQGDLADFDMWFFFIFAFKLVYNYMGWQGSQGCACAARSPHEARMAGILAEWRGGVSYLLVSLIPICAYVLLHNAGFAGQAQLVRHTLDGISDPQVQGQVSVPLSLIQILPVGVAGLFCAAMLAGSIGNDTTYLHAWGSIFVQDVLLPLRGRHFRPETHLLLLRLSIVGVAVFAFFFSLLFPMRDYIYMYQLVTGCIFLGGSGAVIIGGLYWDRGTTAGAWAALGTGAFLSVLGAGLRSAWPAIPALAAWAPQFPLNGAWMALVASVISIVIYIVVSLLTSRERFDMDRMLHRGRYALPSEHQQAAHPHRLAWLGINAEFTRGDRIIYFAKIAWTVFWFVAFIVGTVVALVFGIPNAVWASWWHFTVILGVIVGIITTVWFLWGGFRDLGALIRALRTMSRNPNDDGTVPAAESAHTLPKKAEAVSPGI